MRLILSSVKSSIIQLIPYSILVTVDVRWMRSPQIDRLFKSNGVIALSLQLVYVLIEFHTLHVLHCMYMVALYIT